MLLMYAVMPRVIPGRSQTGFQSQQKACIHAWPSSLGESTCAAPYGDIGVATHDLPTLQMRFVAGAVLHGDEYRCAAQ